MNKKLIEVMIQARKRAEMHQADVGKLLGVKANTISGWETGRTEPDIDVFVEIMQLYGVDPFDAMKSVYGTTNKSNSYVSMEEMEIIKRYRTLDARGKRAVNNLINSECEMIVSEEDIEAMGNGTVA